jgi:SPP1 gp7 family putative phage head morphogenesis protein
VAWKVSADPVDFDEAVAWFRKRVAMTAEERTRLTGEARRQGFFVSHAAQLDVVHDVWKALDAAIAKGTPLADFKREVGPKLREAWSPKDVPDPAWRLETIFRQNVQNAYSAGRYRQATDPDVLDERPVWMFDAILDGRETSICKACDGTMLAAEDKWWLSHQPPLHFNCRSSVITLTEEQAGKLSKKKPDVPVPAGFGEVLAGDGEELAPWLRAKVEAAPEPLKRIARERAILGPGGAGDGAVVAKGQAHDFEPTGTRISAAFELGGGKAKAELQAALDAVDAVHGDGKHHAIPIKQVGGKSQHGAFAYVIGGEPAKITISSAGAYPGVSLLHEIGHFIDNQAIGRRGVNSSADDESPLADVMKAIRDGRAYAEATRMLGRKRAVLNVKGRKEYFELDQGYASYVLRPQELFARAYARYIAVRSGNAQLLAELNREHMHRDVLIYRQSWSDEDFAAVASALDSLFERLGWMKPKTKSP